MEITQLKRFVLIGETLNVHRAAEKAHISQPALSRDLKKLEDELGFLLFERVGKRLILTPRGKRFLERVRPVINELEEAKQWASRLPEEQRDKVVVVAGYTTINFLIPHIAHFLSSHSEIDLRLIAGRDEEALKALETGEADFAVGRYTFLPAHIDPLPLFSAWRVLILNRNGPLRVRGLTLKVLAQLPLCVPGPSSKSYSELVSIFATEGLIPYIVFNAYSNENVRQAVRYNPNWAGILYLHALTERDLEQFKICHLRNIFPSWQVLLLRRKTAITYKAREQVYDFLKALEGPRLDKKGRVVWGSGSEVQRGL